MDYRARCQQCDDRGQSLIRTRTGPVAILPGDVVARVRDVDVEPASHTGAPTNMSVSILNSLKTVFRCIAAAGGHPSGDEGGLKSVGRGEVLEGTEELTRRASRTRGNRPRPGIADRAEASIETPRLQVLREREHGAFHAVDGRPHRPRHVLNEDDVDTAEGRCTRRVAAGDGVGAAGPTVVRPH